MKKINWNECCWFFILFGFSIYLYHLLYSGEILYFVHPRSIKFTTTTMLAFFVLTIFQVKRLTNPSQRPIKWGYLLFLLPLLTGALVAPQGITEEIAVTRGITVAAQDRSGFSLFSPNAQRRIDYSQDEVLELDDVFFDDALNEIRSDLPRYIGQKVSLYGFVFRQDHFDDQTIFVSRLLIVCCAADSLITGILADYEGAAAYEDYTWVEITGVIDQTTYYDPWVDKSYEAPIVRVDSMAPREKPSIPYVYPRNYAGPEH